MIFLCIFKKAMCSKSAIGLNIYSLTLFVFLEHQTSGFYHTAEANLVPLLIFIAQIHIASFTSTFFR